MSENQTMFSIDEQNQINYIFLLTHALASITKNNEALTKVVVDIKNSYEFDKNNKESDINSVVFNGSINDFAQVVVDKVESLKILDKNAFDNPSIDDVMQMVEAFKYAKMLAKMVGQIQTNQYVNVNFENDGNQSYINEPLAFSGKLSDMANMVDDKIESLAFGLPV